MAGKPTSTDIPNPFIIHAPPTCCGMSRCSATASRQPGRHRSCHPTCHKQRDAGGACGMECAGSRNRAKSKQTVQAFWQSDSLRDWNGAVRWQAGLQAPASLALRLASAARQQDHVQTRHLGYTAASLEVPSPANSRGGGPVQVHHSAHCGGNKGVVESPLGRRLALLNRQPLERNRLGEQGDVLRQGGGGAGWESRAAGWRGWFGRSCRQRHGKAKPVRDSLHGKAPLAGAHT